MALMASTVFRYIDWLITVPLWMIEFFLILSAVTKVSTGVFWRLMIGTLVMLVGGYLTGSGPEASANALNLIYNLADVLNKIAFGLIIWSVAVSETEAAKK
jgi:K+ transporter